MTIIQNLTGSATAATTTTSSAASMMDQNDFLRLMTTQLTTQDPFNPVDNTQMVAQMAQFSQVAGIAEMNKSLQAIVASLGGNRLADAASWIGRSMLVESDVATPLRDGTYAGEIELADDADQVTISFVDENGAIVHSTDLGARTKGNLSFAWDGKNEAGESIAGGPLRLVVSARSGTETVTPPTATWTSIGGIQSPANGGASRLVTGLGLLPPEAAIRLS